MLCLSVLMASSASLPFRHQAAASLSRRWASAEVRSGQGVATVRVDWSDTALREADAASQASTFSLHTSLLSAHTTPASLPAGLHAYSSPAPAGLKSRASHPRLPLEFRLLEADGGLVAEVWSKGARVGSKGLKETLGPKPLSAGVFGAPRFSPSGDAIVWTAEKLCGRDKVKGYWAEEEKGSGEEKEKGGGGATEKAPGGGMKPFDKFRPKRGFGETIGVEDSVIVAWKWAEAKGGTLAVWTGDDLLHALPDGIRRDNEWRAVPVHPTFDGSEEGLVFSLSLLPKRGAGLSACLNRRTLLCHMPNAIGAATAAKDAPVASQQLLVLDDGFVASFARLSPDGTRLAYARAADEFAGHSTPFELRLLCWDPAPAGGGSPRPIGSPVTLLDAGVAVDGGAGSDANKPGVARGPGGAPISWYGWCGFHDELASLRWLDDDAILFTSLQRGEAATFVLSAVGTTAGCAAGAPAPELARLCPPSSGGGGQQAAGTSVRIVGAGLGSLPMGTPDSDATVNESPCAHAVLQVSSFVSPPQLWVCTLMPTRKEGTDASLEVVGWAKLEDAAELPATPALAPIRAELLASIRACTVHRLALPADKGGAETFVIMPGLTDEQAAKGAALPWVVRPHGGPHAMSASTFLVDLALLLDAGVAILLPNYRGSLGYGKPFAESLLGRAGEMDVTDVAELTRLALATFPLGAAEGAQAPGLALDPKRGALFGGSHGGFLTAWLLASPEHRNLFSGGVLWNPVVDLPAMLAATDIPEWYAAPLGGVWRDDGWGREVVLQRLFAHGSTHPMPLRAAPTPTPS